MIYLYEKVLNTLLGLALFGAVIICMATLMYVIDTFTASLLSGIPSEVWMFFGLVLILLFAHFIGKSLKELCAIRKDFRQWEKRIQKEESAT